VLRKPVFIVGYRRSGTSLLRSLLSFHPDVAFLPVESHFFTVVHPFRDDNLMEPVLFDRFWSHFTGSKHFRRTGLDADAIRREIESLGTIDLRGVFTCLLSHQAALEGKPRAGEKTPGNYRHLRTILDWYPDAQVVFLMRDPRAIWTSHLKLEEAWAKVDSEKIMRGWRESAYEARKWKRSPYVRIVHYEELVRNPEAELRTILDWLELDYPDGILNRTEFQGPAVGTYHMDGPVQSGSIEKWRETLTSEQVAFVESKARAEMEWHGYATDQIEVRLPDRVAAEIRYLAYSWKRSLGVVLETLAPRLRSARTRLRPAAPNPLMQDSVLGDQEDPIDETP